MVLELVHEHGAITSHLLVTINGQEGDLCEALLWVSAVADAADDSVLPQNSQGGMPIVEDQPHDVIFGHFRQVEVGVDDQHVSPASLKLILACDMVEERNSIPGFCLR